jgi:hypothetical protein
LPNFRIASGTQTDRLLSLLPYEHLFPSALPLPHAAPPSEPSQPDPYSLLDKYIEAAIHSLDKSGTGSQGLIGKWISKIQPKTSTDQEYFVQAINFHSFKTNVIIFVFIKYRLFFPCRHAVS